MADRVTPEESAGTAQQAYVQLLLVVTEARERGEKQVQLANAQVDCLFATGPTGKGQEP